MVIGDFNLIDAGFSPNEADTPLLVDTNAVLPGTLSG